ncbi:N2-acetyl-L-ornithine:2-oxoglutarate 5-aminotransferase [Aureococcus anophagefferens]|nr:N2-acetyl-L-ornithine:2-oxoglutarate 5-aminotransferase [Aureococcus anophagefferens]
MRALLLGLLAAATGVTHDEARCILKDQRVAFFGDSLSRYCFFGMNVWLETGALRAEEFAGKWGVEGEDYDCCQGQQWTDDEQDCDAGSGHRMYLYKDFEDINARTSFYFIASVWFDDLADLAGTLEADTIVYNQGWWQLKDCRGTYCGDDFDDECERRTRGPGQEKGDSTSLQREDLGQVIDHLFSRATTAVYRTTACCGEEDDDWIDGIEAQNAVAKDVMGAAGVPVADVHGYGWDDLDAATFDGFHANVATCPSAPSARPSTTARCALAAAAAATRLANATVAVDASHALLADLAATAAPTAAAAAGGAGGGGGGDGDHVARGADVAFLGILAVFVVSGAVGCCALGVQRSSRFRDKGLGPSRRRVEVEGADGFNDDLGIQFFQEPEKAPSPPRAAFAEPGGAERPAGRRATRRTARPRTRRRGRRPVRGGVAPRLRRARLLDVADERRAAPVVLSPAGSAASPSPRRASAAKLWDDAV